MTGRKTKFVLHKGPDFDCIAGQYNLKNALNFKDGDIEYVFVPPGEKIEIKPEEKGFVFHIDTGKIYNPEKGFFDHHGLRPGDKQYGKCSALLITEYLNVKSPALLTLAWLAQSADKEKDQSKMAEYHPSKQDRASAGILYTGLELITQWNRMDLGNEKIIKNADDIIKAYLSKRYESNNFRKWFSEGMANKKIIIESTCFDNVTALIASECPYSSSDLRKLLKEYIGVAQLIIGCFIQKDGNKKYGIVKTENPTPRKLNLQEIFQILVKKFPHLAKNRTDLFAHNSGFCLYLNKPPENFSFEDFIKLALN